MTPTEACIALNMLPTMGPVRLRKLLRSFRNARAVLAARRDALRAVEGIGNEVADQIVNWESIVDLAGGARTHPRIWRARSSPRIRRSIRGSCARFMRRRSCSTSGAN